MGVSQSTTAKEPHTAVDSLCKLRPDLAFSILLLSNRFLRFWRSPMLAFNVLNLRIGPLDTNLDRWPGKVVMKCELCNSGYREPEQRLCRPCIEAVARLWNIANQEGRSIAGVGEPVERLQVGAALKTASPRSVYLL